MSARAPTYAELQLAYDTAIPRGALELARLGSREAVALHHARAQIRAARAEVGRAIDMLRTWRRGGERSAIALSALHDALRERRRAWRELRAIKREIAEGGIDA